MIVYALSYDLCRHELGWLNKFWHSSHIKSSPSIVNSDELTRFHRSLPGNSTSRHVILDHALRVAFVVESL